MIPETAYMNGTVRHFNPDVQAMVKQRMGEICAGLSAAMGVEVDLNIAKGIHLRSTMPIRPHLPRMLRVILRGMPPLTGTQALKWAPKISVTC